MQKEIDELKSQIRDMKDYLPMIVQKIGYGSVQEFLKDFKDLNLSIANIELQ